MLKKAINTYNKARLNIIKAFANNYEEILDEAKFYDDGYLNVKINHLKKKLNNVINEIDIATKYEKKDNETLKKIKELNLKKDELMLEMCFYASNGINSINMCKELLNGVNSDFEECIDAIITFKNNDEEKAFKLFHSYFSKTKRIPEHFLINKIYGGILYKYGQDKMALRLLQEASLRKPEDIEVHKMLYELYEKENFHKGVELEKMIIEMLED